MSSKLSNGKSGGSSSSSEMLSTIQITNTTVRSKDADSCRYHPTLPTAHTRTRLPPPSPTSYPTPHPTAATATSSTHCYSPQTGRLTGCLKMWERELANMTHGTDYGRPVVQRRWPGWTTVDLVTRMTDIGYTVLDAAPAWAVAPVRSGRNANAESVWLSKLCMLESKKGGSKGGKGGGGGGDPRQ